MGFPFRISPIVFLAPADNGGGDTGSEDQTGDNGGGGGHYNPEQPRDWHGRWTSGPAGEGGGGGDRPADNTISFSYSPKSGETNLLEMGATGDGQSAADPWQAANMADAVLGRSDFSGVTQHYAVQAHYDPAGTRAEIQAVAAEMGKTDPARADAFYQHMNRALPQLFGSGSGTMRGPFGSRIPAPSWGVSAIGDRQEITPAMKEKYTDDHLADAQKVADRLKVPVENILGLSALEGGWGVIGRFPTEGNNFFGLHYSRNDPHASGYLLTSDGAVKVAKYPNYAASANAFADKYGHLVQGVQDPQEFAKRLQDAGLFGINRDGSKVPSYVGGVAGTIVGFKNRLAKRRGAL